MTTEEILILSQTAKHEIATLKTDEKNNILLGMAKALLDNSEEILKANKTDLEKSKDKVSPVMLDR